MAQTVRPYTGFKSYNARTCTSMWIKKAQLPCWPSKGDTAGKSKTLFKRSISVCINVNDNINFNIVFMVTHRAGPILYVCICVTISKMQNLTQRHTVMLTLTLSVKGP